MLQKVTVFVLNNNGGGSDRLLLIRHPFAGIQIPAGTVDHGEEPLKAAEREVQEETSLSNLAGMEWIGSVEETSPDGDWYTQEIAPVYARPDLKSFQWATLRRGIAVRLLAQRDGFRQVSYIEYDTIPNPGSISMQITGWVLESAITPTRTRHFFMARYNGKVPREWRQEADNHLFTCFWAPLNDLPAIISPQDSWLRYLDQRLNKVNDLH